MSGVEAVACVIRGALANAGCGDEVYLYTPEDFHPDDDELTYDQRAIDTLRAQLEAAQQVIAEAAKACGQAQARAEAAEANAARYEWLRNPSIDVALVLDKVTGFTEYDEGSRTGGYHTYEYRAGEELDAAIDAAMARTKEDTK